MESDIPKETPPVVVVPQPQPEKPFHLNKWHVIAVILVAVIVIQGFLYLSLNSRYDTLANQYSALQSEQSTLEASYNFLQTGYNSLQSSYDSYVSSYSSLRNQINKRTLQFNVTEFITPSDPAVQNIVSTITGGWSNTSDWNEYGNDVLLMYDWVVNNIEHRSDGLFQVIPSTPSGSLEYRQEMWQLPKETLDLKQGDCEDMAFLLTSMILFYNGGNYWTECIAISGSIGTHAGVQIPVQGNKLTILDPAGKYYTQTAIGDLTSKDISTEINNWLNHWKPQLGNDVQVERVFSNYVDKSFSSTSEYLTWMSNRYEKSL
jgi:hypothetical protein